MDIDEIVRERRREAVAAEIACLALDGGNLASERLAQLQGYIDATSVSKSFGQANRTYAPGYLGHCR